MLSIVEEGYEYGILLAINNEMAAVYFVLGRVYTTDWGGKN